jgi:site-specific recombinase XerD
MTVLLDAAGRAPLPLGPLFCVIDGPTRGRPWSAAAVRGEFRRLAAEAGVRRRFAPHQLRHAHALELAREGVPLNIIQRQLGHGQGFSGDTLQTATIAMTTVERDDGLHATCHAGHPPFVRS